LRLRTLGALSALAVLVAVIAAMPASGSSSADATETYIVQLVQAPVAGYEGGIAGFAATKPARGKKLNASSADAQKYAGFLTDKHNRALDKVGGGDKIYDYTAVFNGFAAKLTADQAAKLEGTKDVLTVEKAEQLTLDTSSTPAFLGLDKAGGLWAQLGGLNKGGLGKGAGEDMVIGDVDGGYWPENPAFSDRKVDGSNGNAYPHKVTGFSGTCQAGEAFPASTCNDKVIAARFFTAGVGALFVGFGIRLATASVSMEVSAANRANRNTSPMATPTIREFMPPADPSRALASRPRSRPRRASAW